jgi:hypothetical protein
VVFADTDTVNRMRQSGATRVIMASSVRVTAQKLIES